MQKYIIAAWSDKINLFFGFFQKKFFTLFPDFPEKLAAR